MAKEDLPYSTPPGGEGQDLLSLPGPLLLLPILF